MACRRKSRCTGSCVGRCLWRPANRILGAPQRFGDCLDELQSAPGEAVQWGADSLRPVAGLGNDFRLPHVLLSFEDFTCKLDTNEARIRGCHERARQEKIGTRPVARDGHVVDDRNA